MGEHKTVLGILLILCFVTSFSIVIVEAVGASSVMWSKTYGNGKEVGNDLVEASDGGFAIVGYTASFGAGGSDFWLVKTDVNGNMEWNQTYGGAEDESAEALIKTSDGGYAMVGNKHYSDYGECDFWVVKTDAHGNIEWNQTYGERFGYRNVYALVATSDGGYAMGGYVPDGSYSDFWLIKTDGSGNMQWNKSYGRGGTEMAYSMVATSDGGYALAGLAAGAIGTEPYLDSWMVKTDAQGNMEWNQTFAETGDQYIYSIVETSDGAFALAGWRTYTSSGSPYLWIIRTYEQGVIPEFPSALIWVLMLVGSLTIVLFKKTVWRQFS